MTIKQDITGDAQRLISELDKVNRAYAKLEQKVQKLTDESEKGSQAADKQMGSFSSAASSAVVQVTSLAAAYVGVSQAIDMVSTALDRQRTIEQQNLTLQQELANAQGNLVRNAGADIGAINQQIAQIQQETGVGFVPLTEAAGFAVSSKGSGQTRQEAVATMGAAAQLVQDRPDDLNIFTQAGLQIQEFAGVRDPKKALGFMQRGIGLASIADPAQFAQNLAPVMAAGKETSLGDQMQAGREAAALFTTMTKHGETEGAVSGTATIS